ncbi:MAG: hypothetical protein KGQ37_13050 [Hyphomicrobiales bacterium]|nr:hypothetical protein [Hyphomicrobiales bacterium]
MKQDRALLIILAMTLLCMGGMLVHASETDSTYRLLIQRLGGGCVLLGLAITGFGLQAAGVTLAA